jgi:hypothetical protein
MRVGFTVGQGGFYGGSAGPAKARSSTDWLTEASCLKGLALAWITV